MMRIPSILVFTNISGMKGVVNLTTKFQTLV